MNAPRTSSFVGPREGDAPREGHALGDADEALMAKVRAGDEAALRALHRRHAALIFTAAARMLEPAAAEEVVQEVFLTVWQKADAFDAGRGSFKNWAVHIARRRALNELRRRRARGQGAGQGEQELEQAPDESLLPDEASWLLRRREAIRAAVDALPEAERRALSAAFFDELSHDQVASMLHTPLGTTKTRIRSGMKRLAPMLAALAIGAVLLVVWRKERAKEARQERALHMVTASDVVILHLVAQGDVPREAHGNYRARVGGDLSVLTTSHLPKLAGGEHYVAWARQGESWSRLGDLEPNDDGHALLVAEGAGTAWPADEVRITREVDPGSAPRGAAVIGGLRTP